MLDPNLQVTTYTSGLSQPIGVDFIGPDDALVLEKASGQVIGEGFGITPAIEQGPDGNLYVVSLTDGVIYKINRRP